MPRPENPVDPGQGPLRSFAFDLRQLRVQAGSPSYRNLASRTHFSISTLSAAASGKTFPTRAVTLAYVRACGGPETQWEERWRQTEILLTRAPESTAREAKDPVAVPHRARGIAVLAIGRNRPVSDTAGPPRRRSGPVQGALV
jgi:hypothetical protein